MLNDLAKHIQDELNDNPNIQFRITDNNQIYDTWIEMQGNPYVAGILQRQTSGMVIESIETVVDNLILSFYGRKEDKLAFEDAIRYLAHTHRGESFLSDGVIYQIFYSLPNNMDIIDSRDSRNHKMFRADIYIQAQYVIGSISGSSTVIKIDDVAIPFNLLKFRKDKSLIPNVKFGDSNADIKLINEAIEFELPITANTKIQELLVDVLNDSYNKKYTLEWKISGITKTVDVVSRIGTINYNNNNQPVVFTITFERTLPRKDFKIDNVTIPVIRWTLNDNVNVTTISTESGVKSETINNVKGLTVLFLNDGSSKINEIIDEINETDHEKRFIIDIEVNSKTLTYSMIVKDGTLTATEHPDLMIEVVFVEGK